MNSLVDCQCGVLHHPITLCSPGGLRGSHLCRVCPQVFIYLHWPLVSSEVHCGVNYAARVLWETNIFRRQCCRGSLGHKQPMCY